MKIPGGLRIPMKTIGPVRYEMFFHRLWATGEEGRMTLQRVTTSPIVSQGGECMSSFYDETASWCSPARDICASPPRRPTRSKTYSMIRKVFRFSRRPSVLFQRSLRRRLAHL